MSERISQLEAIQRAYALLWDAGPSMSDNTTTARKVLLDALGGRGSEAQAEALRRFAVRSHRDHEPHEHGGRDLFTSMVAACSNLDAYREIMSDGPDASDEALAEKHFVIACANARNVVSRLSLGDLETNAEQSA